MSRTCTALTQRGSLCTKAATTQCTGQWVCHMHATRSTPKNSVRGRKGTIRYQVCMTLQHANYSHTEPVPSPDQQTTRCTYCDVDMSAPGVEKSPDHLYPLITNCRPTPYKIESAFNKVTCCRSCNMSKGKKDAVEWMRARNMPEDRIRYVRERMARVPTWTDEEMALIYAKYDLMMRAVDVLADFGETPIETSQTPERLQEDFMRRMSSTFGSRLGPQTEGPRETKHGGDGVSVRFAKRTRVNGP